MAGPSGNDLRKRMVEAFEELGCCRAVARRFSVAPSTVSRLMKRVGRTGSCAPGKMGGHRKRILEGEADWVRARVEACPETAAKRLREDLIEERRVVASVAAVRRFARSLGSRMKKRGLYTIVTETTGSVNFILKIKWIDRLLQLC